MEQRTSASQKVTLGYWDIRGLGESTRTLLEYLEIPYHMEPYKTSEQWNSKKHDGSLKFPNLPYLVDGDQNITESEAIFAYVCIKAGKHDMIGKNEDRVTLIRLSGVLKDLFMKLAMIMYTTKSREQAGEGVNRFMENNGNLIFSQIEEILEKSQWLLGYLTYLDFFLAELVERSNDMDSDLGTKIMAKFPKVQALEKRIHELPQLKAYRDSGRFKSRPYFLAEAIWQ